MLLVEDIIFNVLFLWLVCLDNLEYTTIICICTGIMNGLFIPRLNVNSLKIRLIVSMSARLDKLPLMKSQFWVVFPVAFITCIENGMQCTPCRRFLIKRYLLCCCFDAFYTYLKIKMHDVMYQGLFFIADFFIVQGKYLN